MLTLSKEQWAWTLFDAGCWGYCSLLPPSLTPPVLFVAGPKGLPFAQPRCLLSAGIACFMWERSGVSETFLYW
jgi:hypothetical protein